MMGVTVPMVIGLVPLVLLAIAVAVRPVPGQRAAGRVTYRRV
ncbi:MAG: hypothetical protein ACUVUC_13435 [Thermoguttaceae bacterium]